MAVLRNDIAKTVNGGLSKATDLEACFRDQGLGEDDVGVHAAGPYHGRGGSHAVRAFQVLRLLKADVATRKLSLCSKILYNPGLKKAAPQT